MRISIKRKTRKLLFNSQTYILTLDENEYAGEILIIDTSANLSINTINLLFQCNFARKI